MNQRIIYSTPEGGVAVIVPSENCNLTIEEIAAKDVPEGLPFDIVDISEVPSDRTFRNAWNKMGSAIDHDMGKAKLIAHDRRRAARAEEFAPLDNIISKQIPGTTTQATESKRAEIRAKYEIIQTNIDAETTIAKLKEIVEQLDK